jgi:hypothetical protein
MSLSSYPSSNSIRRIEMYVSNGVKLFWLVMKMQAPCIEDDVGVITLKCEDV